MTPRCSSPEGIKCSNFAGYAFTWHISLLNLYTIINVSRDTGKKPPADIEQVRVDLTIIIRIAFLILLLLLWDKTCQLVLYAAYPTARLCSTISFAVYVTKNNWQVQPVTWEMNTILLTRVPRAFFNIDLSTELANNASCAYIPLSFSQFSRSHLFMYIPA